MKKAAYAIGALLVLGGCTADDSEGSRAGLFTEKSCPPHTTTIECEGKVGSNLVVENTETELVITNHAEGAFVIVSENIYLGTTPPPMLPDGRFDDSTFPHKFDYSALPPTHTEHRFPLADLGLGCGDTLFVAVRQTVAKLDAAGMLFGYKKGQVSFEYTLCCEEPPPDAGVPEIPPDAGIPEDEGCTLTQGYWKNHPDAWPVTSLEIGGVDYPMAELMILLRTPPAGDASLILVHQLIAAMLNVEAGATGVSAIAEANAFLAANPDADGRLPFGYGSGTSLHGEATALADRLADFNEGREGPGHCDQR